MCGPWYNSDMIDIRSSAIETVVHQVGSCLSVDAARKIAGLRADREFQNRIDILTERNAEGFITPEEREELEGYVAAATSLSVLQAEARIILRDKTRA